MTDILVLCRHGYVTTKLYSIPVIIIIIITTTPSRHDLFVNKVFDTPIVSVITSFALVGETPYNIRIIINSAG